MTKIKIVSKNPIYEGIVIDLAKAKIDKKTLLEEISTTDISAIEKIIDSRIEKKIRDIVTKELKSDGTEKQIVSIVRNCLVQLYKQLWTKRSFWTNGIDNKSN